MGENISHGEYNYKVGYNLSGVMINLTNREIAVHTSKNSNLVPAFVVFSFILILIGTFTVSTFKYFSLF